MKKMQSRIRRHYIGAVNTESESLLGNGRNGFKKPFPWTQVFIGIVALIAVSGLILGAIAVARGGGGISDPLNIETLNVSGSTTLSELEVSNGVSTDTLNVSGSTTLSELKVSNGITTDTLTVSDTANITCVNAEKITTNTTCNTILAHRASGVIPPSHAVQTLEFDIATVPAGVPQLPGAPLGQITSTINIGNVTITNPTFGPWNVVDVTNPSASDSVGMRVIQVGSPNAFTAFDNCNDDDLEPPLDGQISRIRLSSKDGAAQTITLYLRWSTEGSFDFIIVRRNGQVVFFNSGTGSTEPTAFLEEQLNLPLVGSDSIEIEFAKDSICWGGLDQIYFHMDVAPLSPLSMTIPADLTDYVGKEIKVCSLDQIPHTLNVESPLAFDTNNYWPTIQFRGATGEQCCATFSVESESTLGIVSRDSCALFCNNPFHCVDPERPEATNPLHGWWKGETKTLLGISYAHLDTTVVPMRLTSRRGNILNPYGDGLGALLFAVSSSVLSTSNSNGFYDNSDYPLHLTIQPGQTQAIFGQGSGSRNLEFSNQQFNLFSKIQGEPPALDKAFDVPSDPRFILNHFFEQFVYNEYTTLENEDNENWVGFAQARASMDEIISTGVSHTDISIIRTRVTHSSNPEELTEFRTDEYHHASPVGYVTVSGFTGACVALNGKHLVAAPGTSSNPAVNSLFQDYGTNASERTVHHTVAVFLNSSGIPTLPGTNIADCAGSNPVLAVSYGPITAATNYIDTVSAWFYWFYENVKVALHTRPNIYFDASTQVGFRSAAKPRIEWSEVASDIASGDDSLQRVNTRMVGEQTRMFSNPSQFAVLSYVVLGSTANDRLFTSMSDFTGPYGIRPEIESSAIFNFDITERLTYWHHIPAKNYLEQAAYPAWKTVGTSRSHPYNLFVQASNPGGGGDEFETIMVPFGEIPPTNYSYLDGLLILNTNGGAGYPYTFEWNNINELLQEQFFVGRINTTLTGGVKIGYIRVAHSSIQDQGLWSEFAQFCPTGLCDINSPRNNREALDSIYATSMNYLLMDLECDHIILDIRGNLGGSATVQPAMAEFFGSDDYTPVDYAFSGRTGNGYGKTYDMKNFQHPETVLEATLNTQKVFPSISAANYPSAVFTEGNLVILDSMQAGSGGDIFPNNFLGANLDKQLGSNTNVSIIGSIDGRLSGYACSYTYPINSDNPRNVDAFGNPVSLFSTGTDCGATVRRSDGSSLGNRHPALEIDQAPTLQGLSGSNALPGDWDELVYKDFGFVTNDRARLTGDSRPQTPANFIETDPLSTVNGSNVVTVTTSAPHGFSTGDSVSLAGGSETVPSVSGIPSFALTGGHIITVTGANSFTFEATGEATYDCYPLTNCAAPTPATATASNVGGTIRIMNRNHWRDAWLEQAILKALASPAKKRSAPQKKKKQLRATKQFNAREARAIYGRDVTCPSNMTLHYVSHMEATKMLIVDTSSHNEQEISQKLREAQAKAVASIKSELENGGMCLDATGALMATPTCKEVVKVSYLDRKNPHLPRNAAAGKKKKMLLKQ